MKVPSGMHLWATYLDAKGKEKWAILSDFARIKWYLYNLEGEKPQKVKTGKSPKDFEAEVGRV